MQRATRRARRSRPNCTRELPQQVLPARGAVVRRNLVQHIRHGEVLEQRDDVGERLVEGEHVGVGGLAKPAMQAIEQRVRRLVRDDVVRKARRTRDPGKSAPASHRGAGNSRTAAPSCPGCSRRWPRAGRADRCAGAARTIVGSAPRRRRRSAGRRPQGQASERALEVFDRPHRDRVDHLLMELRVGFRRRAARPATRRWGWLRSTRRVAAPARRIDVDDLEILADRTRLRSFSHGTATVASLTPSVRERRRLGS